MKKILTLEWNKQDETIELHLNKIGAQSLRDILNDLISNDEDEHIHLMTPDWGGGRIKF